MGETLLGKNCTTCKHFTSYYEEYDFDEFEPRYAGRCDIDEDDKNIDEDYVCELYEKEEIKL